MTGDEYPAPMMNQYISSFVGVFQIAFIGFMFIGPTIFQKMGMETPGIFLQLQDKKFMVIMAAFILGNMIKNQLLATGAFEIYFDDKLVFSKLNTEQVPNIEIIDTLLHSHNVM